MANLERVVGGWMRGRVVGVARVERGAARGREMANGQMANGKFGVVMGDWMGGRMMVVVRGERGAARKSEGAMKKVLGLVLEAGRGRAARLAPFVRP